MSSFQLSGLPAAQFAHLKSATPQELALLGARRVIADTRPGFPCRISLEDAEPGEELILLPYAHLCADSPYRSSGPIFIRAGASQCVLRPGHVPEYVSSRLISARAYDSQHMMVSAEVCEGKQAAQAIERLFENAGVQYIHLHNARPGCFSCTVQRVN